MTFAARADIMRDALHRKHGANSDESNAIPAETDDGTIRKISIRDACQRAPPGADRTRVPHSLSMSEYPAQLDSRNLCVKINLVARDDPSVAAYADKSGLAHQQPDPAVIGGGQGSLQAARRDRRALLRPQPRSRRMRRTWLRGRENVHKRYLLHVAGHNLSLLMRQLIGAGTPREAVAGGYGGIFVLLTPTGAMLVALGVSQSGQTVFAAAFLIWE